MPNFRPATTASNIILAGKFHHLIFETPDIFTSQPGQYVSLKVSDQQMNNYSIASRPNNNRFVLLVDTAPGGTGSKFFETLKSNDPIQFLGPFGKFSLNLNDGAQKLLFLCTGSGVSPLRSMIEDALIGKNTQLPIALYFGLRRASDIFWDDYFTELKTKYPNFTYKLSLSKPDETWHGSFGHITEHLTKDIKDGSGYGVYLCGNGGMIEQATEIMLSLGCPKERIYTEKFY